MTILETAVLTVKRERPYFTETITSLQRTASFDLPPELPLRVIAGAPGPVHLEEARALRGPISFHEMSEEEARTLRYDRLGPKRKCAFGHFRAMGELESLTSTWDAALICEDDLAFADGWREYLFQTLEDIRRIHGERWILTLYRIKHPDQTPVSPYVKAGRRWIGLPAQEEFWGTQAIVYSRAALSSVRKYLWDKSISTFVHPVDIAIGMMAEAEGIPILASVPSLVQHIGKRSTGQSKWFHRAECFYESVVGDHWRNFMPQSD